MKRIAIVMVIGVLIASCTDHEAELTKLRTANEELQEDIRLKDLAVSDLVDGLESIQMDMRDITEREQLLDGLKAGDLELSGSPQQAILDDIALVDGLIKKNQDKIQSLELKLKSSNGQLYEFERVVANLKMDLLEKEKDIDQFKAHLVELEEGYAGLMDDYNEQMLISNMQDEALHKAYFAYGSKEELEEMEVAEKEGGVLGLGATWKLKDDFNKSYFTELDIREVQRLPIESEDVEFISSHPQESYELVKDGKQFKEIIITDPEEFWSGTRYLAVAVR